METIYLGVRPQNPRKNRETDRANSLRHAHSSVHLIILSLNWDAGVDIFTHTLFLSHRFPSKAKVGVALRTPFLASDHVQHLRQTYKTLCQSDSHGKELLLENLDHVLHAVVENVQICIIRKFEQVLDDLLDLGCNSLLD